MGSLGGSAPQQQVPESTRNAAEQAALQHNDYTTRFLPQAEQYTQDIEVTDGDRANARGMANADTTAATRMDLRTAALNRVSGGTAPSVGASASAFAAGAAEADNAMDDLERERQLKVAAHGRGLQHDANSSQLSIGQRAAAKSAAEIKNRRLKDGAKLQGLGDLAAGAYANYQGYQRFKDKNPGKGYGDYFKSAWGDV